MDGVAIRLGKLFDRTSGRSFIIAFDHGLTSPAPISAGSPAAVLGKIAACHPDGVLLSAGMLRKHGELFATRQAPSLIVRSDFMLLGDNFPDYGHRYQIACGIETAARLGADAIITILALGVDQGDLFAHSMEMIAAQAQEAHKTGIPVIVEATLWGGRIADTRDPEQLALACRMAVELGADAVKTEYTGDVETMKSVIDACGVPVVTLGGPKTDALDGLLEATRGAMSAGASGVAYGRNVWLSDDANQLTGQLREIIHGQPVTA